MAEEQKPNYSPDNWAHKALLLMDEADALIRWASVSHPDPEKYKAAAKSFWDVCHLLAAERKKLHNVKARVELERSESESSEQSEQSERP